MNIITRKGWNAIPGITQKIVFGAILTITMGLLIGCNRNTPEAAFKEKQELLAIQVNKANAMLESGNFLGAIDILEKLAEVYPQNVDILEGLAFAHAQQGEHGLAAFYFEQLYRERPKDKEYALYAAQEYTKDGQNELAVKNYYAYLEGFPEDIKSLKALANLCIVLNWPEQALQAYLKVQHLNAMSLSAEDALKVGQLYYDLKNWPQAIFWYQNALADSAENVQALIHLIQAEYQSHDFNSAEKILAKINAIDPFLIEQNHLESIRDDLMHWRNLQNELEGQNLLRRKKEQEDARQQSKPSLLEQAEKSKGETGNIYFKNVSIEMRDGAIKVKHDEDEDLRSNSEAAQAAGQDGTPSKGQDGEQGNAVEEKEDSEKTIDRDLSGHSHTLENEDQGSDVSSGENVLSNESLDLAYDAPIRADGSDMTAGNMEAFNREKNLFVQNFASAERAMQENAYEDAIAYYTEALTSDLDSDRAWNGLADAYLNFGDTVNAEMAALESIRLNPNDLTYRRRYLQAIEKSQNKGRFLNELIKTHRQFPDDSDVTFDLAKAYEKIDGNKRNARYLYELFLKMAPQNHEKRREAEVALMQLP